MTAYDFLLFYHAAAVVTRHHPQELYDLSAGVDMYRIYRQPPIAASLMQPFTWLRYDSALLLWRMLLIACAIVAVVALVRALGLNRSGALRGWPAIALVMLTLVWMPMRETIALGQWDAPILLLLVLALIGLRRGIPALTGIALGLASAVKIYPVYLVVFLVMKREWRAVGWLIASGAALSGLGIVIGGWDTTRYFLRYVLPIGGGSTSDPENQSVMGLVIRLIGDRGASILSALVFLIVTGLLIWRLRTRTERGDVAYAGDYGLTICAMLLVIPVAWIHYETVLLLPTSVIALLLARRPAISLPWLMVAIGSVALLTVGDRTSLLASLPYDTRDLGRAILLSTRLFAQGGLLVVLWRLTADSRINASLDSPADAQDAPAMTTTDA